MSKTRVPIRKNGPYNSTWGQSAKPRVPSKLAPRHWPILEYLAVLQSASLKELEREAVIWGWGRNTQDVSQNALVRNQLKYLSMVGAIRHPSGTIGDGCYEITDTGRHYLRCRDRTGTRQGKPHPGPYAK